MKAHSRYLLNSILGGVWCITPQAANAFLPLVKKLLNSESVFDEPEEDPRQFAKIVSRSGQVVELKSGGSISDIVTESGSVAVIPMIDPIVKYDMFCGPVGTLTRAAQVRELDANEKITAIVFLFDTPGGETSATEVMETAIRQCQKPTYGLVQGTMASAGVWIGSACDRLYISSETDLVGSIGTMCTLANYDKALAKEGIKLHEIYASASRDKNREYREAVKGNYRSMQQNILNPLNDAFKATVTRNRPQINRKTALTGRVFVGRDAIKHGLVDGKTNLENLIFNIMFGTNLKEFKGKNLTPQQLKKLEAKLQSIGIRATVGAPKAEDDDEAESMLLTTADQGSIYVYAEEGEDPVGKQCVWADENGEPTDENVEDGDYPLNDDRTCTVSTHDDGLSYIDSLEPAASSEETDTPAARGKKPAAASKAVKGKPAAAAKGKQPALSADSRALMKGIKSLMQEQKEEFYSALEELRDEIGSDQVPPTESNAVANGKNIKSNRQKTGMSAIQRTMREIQAKHRK